MAAQEQLLLAAAEAGEAGLSTEEQAQLPVVELREMLPFPSINRPALGGWWEGVTQGGDTDRMALGKVGEADCRLFSIVDFVDSCTAEVWHPQPPHSPSNPLIKPLILPWVPLPTVVSHRPSASHHKHHKPST